jgi:IS5 family transposase
LLETHDLCKGLFAAINADLTARGLLLREGTLVDATLIAAPPSTKNQKSNATRKCIRPARAANGVLE